MKSAVYWGQLMHNRIRPRKHRFSYRVASWLIDLDELNQLDDELKLFSVSRFNVLSFHPKDFADGSGNCLKTQATRLLLAYDIPAPEQIFMLCYPRVLGYIFNPLTVYYCLDSEQKLSTLIYEVSNTFGERHSYVIPIENSEGKKTTFHQSVKKQLHVSPFFETECEYRFKARLPDQILKLGIHLHNADGQLFAAVLKGERQALSDLNILRQLFVLPLQAFKVTLAIHWEALRLFIKGVRVVRHVPKGRFFSWSRGITHRWNSTLKRTGKTTTMNEQKKYQKQGA
ncbi:DUF1365 domain-containing protein [Endozoicomonas sp. ALC020]|uniref:DUF1365 domain-containing protein n=1 Tax=unclassified Endozoicomonas TaxID=2644528 RepID=UPI003BAE63EC